MEIVCGASTSSDFLKLFFSITASEVLLPHMALRHLESQQLQFDLDFSIPQVDEPKRPESFGIISSLRANSRGKPLARQTSRVHRFPRRVDVAFTNDRLMRRTTTAEGNRTSEPPASASLGNVLRRLSTTVTRRFRTESCSSATAVSAGQATLVFRDVCVAAGKTEILKTVSGLARAGEMLAVMGPSGQ
jgi:ABC-type multidrug transport system fused ATPase/permease subunit